MANTAVKVTNEFHKDVERVSRPKLQGTVVRNFQAMFAPIAKIRISKLSLNAETGAIVVQRAPKGVKFVAKKKKKK